MEVIGIGTAYVSHHANTHASTANIFRLVVAGPLFSNLTHRQIMVHNNGPNRMKKLLSVKRDLIALLDELKLCELWIESWSSGRRGALGSFTTS